MLLLLAQLVLPAASGPRPRPPMGKMRRSTSSLMQRPPRPSSSPTVKPAPGMRVSVLQKQHYACGTRTNGTVARVLTRSSQHSRGFKVLLECGIVGRVADIVDATPRWVKQSTSVSEADRLLEMDIHLHARPAPEPPSLEPPPRPGPRFATTRNAPMVASAAASADCSQPVDAAAAADALAAENAALKAALLAELAGENAQLRAALGRRATERRYPPLVDIYAYTTTTTYTYVLRYTSYGHTRCIAIALY